jgi:hypothetical protein
MRLTLDVVLDGDAVIDSILDLHLDAGRCRGRRWVDVYGPSNPATRVDVEDHVDV